MNLYNTINGVSSAAFWFLPMLGKHPEQYPRFRDCFLTAAEDDYSIPAKYKQDHIIVFTRTGGGNREYYERENNEIKEHPCFVYDSDDSFDTTFANWIFSVPSEWKEDYILLAKGKRPSDAYFKQIHKVYPKLEDKIKELQREETNNG